jgi:hypothetical protein
MQLLNSHDLTSNAGAHVNDAVMTMSPNPVLKAFAAIVLFAVLAHPSVYATFWERREWYLMICAIVGLPIMLPWCARVFVWRVRITSSTIEVRSLRGVLKRNLSDVARVERAPGKVLMVFKDGAARTIPSLVGNLDVLTNEIESRCGDKLPIVRRHGLPL